MAQRWIDEGGPFALWAPPKDPAQQPCGHGVWVDIDAPSASSVDAITLRLRPAEQIAAHSARVDGEPVTAVLSLATGRCSPGDEHAQRFLDQHPWLAGEVASRLPWLRERVRRAAAQRDRERACLAALRNAEPGAMLPYDNLFPADWDLLVQYDGQTYWAIDLHCLNPACSCAHIVVQFHRIESPKAEDVGDARLDLRNEHQPPTASTPLAAQLFARLWERRRDELLRRREEVRHIVLGHATGSAVVGSPAVKTPRRRAVGRNAPCPCGSGKKYKRCCADRDEASARPTPR